LSLSKRLSFRRRVPDLPEELVAVTKVSCADGFVERGQPEKPRIREVYFFGVGSPPSRP